MLSEPAGLDAFIAYLYNSRSPPTVSSVQDIMWNTPKSLIAVCCLLLLAAGAFAQGRFKTGDAVLASPSMLKDEKYYKQCTVVRPEGSSYVVNCDGSEYVVSEAYVRAGAKPPVAQEQDVKPAAGDADAQKFKVGERVLATVNGVKGEKNYRPCTVIGPLKDGAYALRCDLHNGMPANGYSVRPEWIRSWDDPTPEPSVECPFTKNYPKPDGRAPASAALFKSVIFEWERSISDFYDFGMTFLEFQMGRSFRNRVFPNGRRDVDSAPIGVTVHEVKSKELICQKSTQIIKRWVREIEYACYRDTGGEWKCDKGAPNYLEQTSIPIK